MIVNSRVYALLRKFLRNSSIGCILESILISLYDLQKFPKILCVF